MRKGTVWGRWQYDSIFIMTMFNLLSANVQMYNITPHIQQVTYYKQRVSNSPFSHSQSHNIVHMDKIEQREMLRAMGLATAIHIHTHVTYCSVPGKRPLSGKHPCTAFQWASAHVGQNSELCLSAHGRLPETLQYSYTCVQGSSQSAVPPTVIRIMQLYGSMHRHLPRLMTYY